MTHHDEEFSGMAAYDDMQNPHVVDRNGIVWRVVRDGGMVTRADYGGIETCGIKYAEDTVGPLRWFDPSGVTAVLATCDLVDQNPEGWGGPAAVSLARTIRQALTGQPMTPHANYGGQCLPTTAQLVLGRMLHDIADALAKEADVPTDSVVIGPVDFGDSDG